MASSTKKKVKSANESPVRAKSFGVLILPENPEEGIKGKEALISSPNIQEVICCGSGSDKVKSVSHTDKTELLAELKASDTDLWFVSNGDVLFNVAKSIQTISNEDLEEKSWFTPYKISTSDNSKPGIGQLFSGFIYNVFTSFFSPSNHKNARWNSFFVKKEALIESLELFNSFKAHRVQNHLSLLSKQKERGTYEAVAAQSYKRPAKSTRKGISGGLSDYVFWFFKAPFVQWKQSNLNFTSKFELLSRFMFGVLCLLAIIGMPLLSFDYGITWDESLQYNFAKDMYKYFATWGEDESVFDTKKGLWAPMQFYGSFFDLLTATINEWFGIEDEYAARHFINALYGAMGMLFVGLSARALTGTWTAGFFALLLIVLSPSFFGHSMNNPKDIPFATGFIAATYYIIRLLKELPRPSFATVLILTLSIASALSIRVGALLLFAYLLMGMGLHWLNYWVKDGQKTAMKYFFPYLKIFGVILVFGWLMGIMFWPFALKAPIGNVMESLDKMSNFSFLTTYETFEGVRTNMKELPWYYSVKHIAIGAPLVVLLGFILQIFGMFGKGKRQMWLNLLVFFMVAFPLFWAVYKDSMLYNAWRHSLFIYANIVILAGAGWAWLVQQKYAIVQYTALALVCIGGGRVAYWMIKEHPNEYLYFNELTGGTAGAYGNYELDYYSNTLKQAAEWMVENVDVKSKKITIAVNNEPLTAQWYFDQYTDSVDVLWTREYELTKKETDYAIFNTRTMSRTTLTTDAYPPKGTIHTIDVDGVPVCAIIKRENQYVPEAYALIESGRAPEAIAPLEKAVAYDPYNDEAWRMLAMAYMNTDKNLYPKAEEALDKAIEVLPENFIAYDMKGMIAFNAQDFTKADSLFQLSAKYKVNYTNAHYNRGISLLNLGNYVDAATEFENSIKYGGHKAEFYKYLGICYMSLNQLDQAIQMLGNSSQINPNDPQVYQYLGQAFARKGDNANAEKYMQQARQMMGN